MNLRCGRYCEIVPVIIFTLVHILAYATENSDREVCGCILPCYSIVCYKKELRQIPSYLDDSMHVILFSHNPIEIIRKVDFENCTQLEELHILYNQVIPKIEPEAFTNLLLLRHLSLDGTIIHNTTLIYPVNIVCLSLTSSKANENNTDLSNLGSLENLTMGGNLFTRLPKLHRFAPLKSLMIQANPFKRLSAKQIARYCRLKHLGIHSTNDALRYHACECQRLKEWIYFREINLLDFSNPSFLCISAKPCRELLITDRMQELYKNCLDNSTVVLEDDYDPNYVEVESPPEMEYSKKPKILIFVAVVVVLSTIITTIFILYLKSARKREIVDRHVASKSNGRVDDAKELENEDNEF